jgi:cobalt-zinc-cadmium efflux system membrane fusion protein
MRSIFWRGSVPLALLSAAALLAGGCGHKENNSGQVAKRQSAAEKRSSDDSETWWCKEHGVPERLCGQCDAKLAVDFKKKGDWCKEHDRPESQCFICHPELKEKFAAQYRAKYGKEPPPTEEDKKGESAENEGPKK